MYFGTISYDFIINFVAGIAGLLVVLWIERQRRPKILMKLGKINRIGEDDLLGRPQASWLYVQIHNSGVPKWLSWVYNGEPAMACRAWITFHYHLDGHLVFHREMSARWSETPEPIVVYTEVALEQASSESPTAAPPDFTPVSEKQTKSVVLSKIQHIQESVDIPPGEYSNIDVVVRMNGEDGCFGWNNDSYLHNWKHPAWRLENQRYIAKVRVKTGGKQFVTAFLIFNDGPYDSFRLEPIDKETEKRVKKLLYRGSLHYKSPVA